MDYPFPPISEGDTVLIEPAGFPSFFAAVLSVTPLEKLATFADGGQDAAITDLRAQGFTHALSAVIPARGQMLTILVACLRNGAWHLANGVGVQITKVVRPYDRAGTARSLWS